MVIYTIKYGTINGHCLHFTHGNCYTTKELAEEEMAKLKAKHIANGEGGWYVPNYYHIETLFLDK